METIKVTVVKTSGYREPIVYKSEDWEILKPLARGLEIEQEYTIYAEDGKEFSNVVVRVYNMLNDGTYYSTCTWLTRFRNIISKVNQEDKPEEKLKEYE